MTGKRTTGFKNEKRYFRPPVEPVAFNQSSDTNNQNQDVTKTPNLRVPNLDSPFKDGKTKLQHHHLDDGHLSQISMEEVKQGNAAARLRKSSTPEKQRKRLFHSGRGGETTRRRKQRSRKHINLFDRKDIDELVDQDAIHLQKELDGEEDDEYADLGTINDYEDDD